MQSAAATVVQSAWRGYSARAALDAELLRLGVGDAAAVNIQAAWRGRVARDEVLLQHLAATDIQAHWRGKLHRDDILLQHLAAVDIQSRYRGHRTRQSASVISLRRRRLRSCTWVPYSTVSAPLCCKGIR